MSERTDALNTSKSRKYTNKLPPEHNGHRTRFRNMLDQFQEMWDGHLGKMNAVTYKVKYYSPEPKQIHAVQYRAYPKPRESEKEEVHIALEMKFIEPAQTEWALLIELVPKTNGTLPFRVDCRKPNSVTIRDSYRLPWMNECIDSLGNASIVFILDANSGYW